VPPEASSARRRLGPASRSGLTHILIISSCVPVLGTGRCPALERVRVTASIGGRKLMEFPIEAVTRTRSLSTPQAGSLGPHCHGRHLDHNFKLSPRFQARVDATVKVMRRRAALAYGPGVLVAVSCRSLEATGSGPVDQSECATYPVRTPPHARSVSRKPLVPGPVPRHST